MVNKLCLVHQTLNNTSEIVRSLLPMSGKNGVLEPTLGHTENEGCTLINLCTEEGDTATRFLPEVFSSQSGLVVGRM